MAEKLKMRQLYLQNYSEVCGGCLFSIPPIAQTKEYRCRIGSMKKIDWMQRVCPDKKTADMCEYFSLTEIELEASL